MAHFAEAEWAFLLFFQALKSKAVSLALNVLSSASIMAISLGKKVLSEELSVLSQVKQSIGTDVPLKDFIQQAQDNSRQLDALAQISSSLSSGKYLREILDGIVGVTAQWLGSRICSVMLLDEKSQELVIKASQSLSESYRNKPNIPVGTGISGKVALSKQPIIVEDVRKDKRFRFAAIAQKEGLCSLASIPMLIKDKLVGVINCYTAKPHVFQASEIKVLQAIANQCAVAVENAQLREKALSAEEELDARKWVDRAKGILMKKGGLGEDEAYKLLRKKSMDIRRPMKEVAQVIVLAAQG